jgi:hypothetical protein
MNLTVVSGIMLSTSIAVTKYARHKTYPDILSYDSCSSILASATTSHHFNWNPTSSAIKYSARLPQIKGAGHQIAKVWKTLLILRSRGLPYIPSIDFVCT